MFLQKKGISVFQEHPEPFIGLAGSIGLAIASVVYFDTWYPYVEGANRFCRSVSTVRSFCAFVGPVFGSVILISFAIAVSFLKYPKC